MSEPSVFLDATLPRANERERILVDFRAATLPLPVDRLQTLCPQGGSCQTLSWNGAWHRQLVHKALPVSTLFIQWKHVRLPPQRLCIYLKEC